MRSQASPRTSSNAASRSLSLWNTDSTVTARQSTPASRHAANRKLESTPPENANATGAFSLSQFLSAPYFSSISICYPAIRVACTAALFYNYRTISRYLHAHLGKTRAYLNEMLQIGAL